MNTEIIKKILPGVVFVLFLVPVFTSSLIDLQQRQKNAQILAVQQAAADVAEKIYLLGKFDPTQNPDFVPIPATYNVGGYAMYLRQETLSAFLDMAGAAEKDGVKLKIASATRNFDYQKNLWNNKWEALAKTMPDGHEIFEKILEYSAVPGTSRHHWGTEIDFNSVDPKYYNNEPGEEIYDWLQQNAIRFGFCQPYTLKGTARPEGYNEEKWHWTYLPLSKQFTEDYRRLITDADISGFDGDQYVKDFNLIPYVFSLNPDCI